MDNMRTVATLSVIMVHVIYGVVSQNYLRNMPYFWIGHIIDSGLRFCVPIFLMLSGASLLGKDSSYSDFIKKRFSRIFFPFLFWSLVYIWYAYYMAPAAQKPHSTEMFWPWLSKLFWEKNICMHFWYLYTILVIYLFVPFIGRWVRKLSEKGMRTTLISWVIYCSVLTIIGTQFALPHVISRILNYTAYAGYLVLGFYLANKDFSSIKTKYLASIGFLFSIAFTAIVVYYHSKYSSKLDLSLYGYYWISSVIQSISLFIIIKEGKVKNPVLIKISETISSYSFGIYLVHVAVLGFLYLGRIYWTMAHPLISVPLVVLICLTISFSIIYVLRKIPGGKYVAG